ncbi:hypothetical protein E6O75_ATG09610 [Venturia nashicola]|uniref:Vacuolar protein sorting-associated protein 62 n=1 Tax=Venturia nashicola TaxID=86259 RepID=A0A4Z1NR62_9PEZI|nr:hypothetical protein E6O75_ATG09610 [Venturia nashicola]
MRLQNYGRPATAPLSFLSSITLAATIVSCVGRVEGQKPPYVSGASNAPSNVPAFVIKYAPLVYLHPQEPYMPSDIGAQVTNSKPKLDFAGIPNVPSPLGLDNLDALNNFGNKGLNIYLTSNDDITKNPQWIKGVKPNADGKTEGAKSCAVIVVNKGNGIVDAFYMYFYAFNYGGVVVGKNLGNHVGDWEHNMVRFQDGLPIAVWYSQHSSGQSFKYSAVQKDWDGLRPVAYSGNGSHAVYATAGKQTHDKVLNDHTGTGALWDPIKSAYWYNWSPPTKSPAGPNIPATRDVANLGLLTPYDASSSPVGWFYFQGRWGDLRYKKDDPRQSNLLGLGWRYDSGPNGPAFKNLQRQNVSPDGEKGALLGSLASRENL